METKSINRKINSNAGSKIASGESMREVIRKTSNTVVRGTGRQAIKCSLPVPVSDPDVNYKNSADRHAMNYCMEPNKQSSDGWLLLQHSQQ